MKLSKIKLTPPIAAISVMFLTLTGVAAPKIVYVAPDGTGDGSSWENAMGSVSNAYASAAAFAEGGYDRGEVWIKRGVYFWSAKLEVIEMQSHVTVRGGFAGGETSADQARPDVNNSVLTGDIRDDAVWCPNSVTPAAADQVRLWRMEGDNPVLNEPDILPGTNYVAVSKSLYDCQNGFVARTGVTDCEFNGVVFSCFYYDSISINVASTDVRIRRCTFVGGDAAQGGAATGAGIHVTDTPMAVLDCNFICCWNAVAFSYNTVYGHTLFSNCVVRKCSNSAFYLGQSNITALKSSADSSLTCKDCLFEDGYSGSGSLGLTLAIATAPCTLRVSDCIFRNNRMLGKYVSGTVPGSDGLISTTGKSDPSSPQLFERCQFIGNRMEAEGDWARSACLFLNGLGRNDCIRDCYFASNTVRHTGAAATGSAAVARVSAGNHYVQVINSTFEDNAASVTNEGAFAGLFVWSGSNIRFGLVNCVFRGSRLSSATEGYAAEVFGYSPAAAGTALIFGNTIFANDAEDYRFWNYYMPSGTTKPYVVGVAVPDLDKVDKSAFYGITSSITASDPKLAKARTGENGAVACGVGYDSAYAKNAYPVCLSADGNYCLFHTKESASTRWRIAPTAGSCNDATAESTYGVTSASPLIPDAFGAERTEKRVAYGPLNAPMPGLMLFLR